MKMPPGPSRIFRRDGGDDQFLSAIDGPSWTFGLAIRIAIRRFMHWAFGIHYEVPLYYTVMTEDGLDVEQDGTYCWFCS